MLLIQHLCIKAHHMYVVIQLFNHLALAILWLDFSACTLTFSDHLNHKSAKSRVSDEFFVKFISI